MPERPTGRPVQGNDESLARHVDDLRAQLNDNLAAKRFDDAVAAARELRDILKAQPRLDPRQLKSLVGAESVLRRFAAEGSTNIPKPSKWRWVFVAAPAALILLVVVTLLLLSRASIDPYSRDFDKALDTLDKIDGAVSKGVTLSEYESKVRAASSSLAPFFQQYKDQKKGDVAYGSLVAALGLYERGLTDWSRLAGRSSGKPEPKQTKESTSSDESPSPSPTARRASLPYDLRLSTSDISANTPLPRIWLAAHTLKMCARAAKGKEKRAASGDRSTLANKLAGHYSDGSTDVYYGMLDSGTSMGWYIRTSKYGPVEAGAYEASGVLPGASPSPSPTPGAPSRLKKDELEIVRYTSQPSLIIVRLVADRYSEAASSGQLLRLDDKTLP